MDDPIKEIFDNNYVALCSYAAQLVKDRQLAEDIVQNVFIQLWEKGKFSKIQQPEPFLLRCVRYKCIDYMRSTKNRKEVLMKDLPDLGLDRSSAMNEEDIEPMLSYILSKLPPKMRQVFTMSREETKTYRQIAEELDISIKTVENQMGTALKKIRAVLKELQIFLF